MTPAQYAEQAVARLAGFGIPIRAGLTPAELGRLETELGCRFCPVHRALLAAGVPHGTGWPDWRGERSRLDRQLAAPLDGVLFDVVENGLWPTGWASRPAEPGAAARLARRELARVPRLLPLYRHRYLPAAPAPEPTPVLSVVQGDVITYGIDLLDYLEREFGGRRAPVPAAARVPFWSELGDS